MLLTPSPHGPRPIAPACAPPRHPQRPSSQVRLQGQCVSPSSSWGEGSSWARFPRWCFFLSSRMLLPSLFRSLTAFMRLPRVERTLPTLAPSPAQHRVTQQIIARWQPFKDLKQTFAVSRRAEQLGLHTQQRVVATVEDSALHAEMGALESQEQDAPKRVLWYKPMGFLGVIRPHRRDEAWAAGLWQSFFATVSVHISWRWNSRLVVAESSLVMFLVIMLAPVLPIPEPKRLTIGQSSNSLTYFSQHIG
jgi:hypothetical protein